MKVVRNKYCTFYFLPRTAYLKTNDCTYVIESKSPTPRTAPLRLKDGEFLDLIDTAYRYRIKSHQLFVELIYTKYKLTRTSRRFK